MKDEIRIASYVSIFTLLLTGGVYPLLVTGLAHLFFYNSARGSLVFNEKKEVIGSELIGQSFKNPAYFFSRPSFAGKGYDGLKSGGSNDSPTSNQFITRVYKKMEELGPYNSSFPPLDLVTSSGSGLDPHISPEAAYWQAPRVALHRNVPLEKIVSIIDDHIEKPQFYILGFRRVNVLKLNLSLNKLLRSLP